jgi:hypothetical protein
MKLAFLAVMAFLAGCAAMSGQSIAPPGGAMYEYAHAADGSCSLHIVSDRDLAAPELTLGKDCELAARATATSGLAAGVAQQAVLIQAVINTLVATGLLVPK